jgi:hypothetical protein
MPAIELRDVSPGTTVDHPGYGSIEVVGRLDRGELSNVAGFSAGVWVIVPGRGRIVVWEGTRVEVG